MGPGQILWPNKNGRQSACSAFPALPNSAVLAFKLRGQDLNDPRKTLEIREFPTRAAQNPAHLALDFTHRRDLSIRRKRTLAAHWTPICRS